MTKSTVTLVLAVVAMGMSLGGCTAPPCKKCGGASTMQAPVPAAREGVRAESRGAGQTSFGPAIIEGSATAYGDAGYDRARN